MRTQETFGAAAPGRRVLYSASWVLARLRRGGDAGATVAGRPCDGQAPGREKSDRTPDASTEHARSRPRSGREDLTTQRYGEHRAKPLGVGHLERVGVVGAEVGVHAGLE